jgi:nonribosomal peptide synthetase DhbF
MAAHDKEGAVTAAGCVHEIFEERAARTPTATALISAKGRLSYGELNARADRLAQRLAEQGTRRGSLVGIHVARSPEMVVAILAVLKAGAGYLMLDPEFPADRLRRIVADTGLVIVIVDAYESAGRLGVAGSVVHVNDGGTGRLPRGAGRATPADVACVMFTSGSTGRPKGVVSSHAAIADTLVAQEYASFGPDSVWLQCSPFSWDAFALELWGSLLFGGVCVIHPGRPDPMLMARLAAKHGITTMNMATSLFHVIMDEFPATFEGIREVIVGGEVLSPAHAGHALRRFPGLRLVNGYGPVEGMIFVTTHDVTADGVTVPSVPIGRALAGKHVYVLDDLLRPVAGGETGELYISGKGLAYGYLGQPGLSAERFVADPFGEPGDRMYRTGDLARWRLNRPLEYVGRKDHQVKIRGIRVEPAEVEAVLGLHPAVKHAVVICRENKHKEKQLIAYVVPRAEWKDLLVDRDLRAYALDALPDFMVPHTFIAVDSLPRTAIGKVDRAALLIPKPDGALEGEEKC